MTAVAMFHMEHNENTQSDQSVSRCKCGNEAREGQRNCAACHRIANREYRARRKIERALMRLSYNKLARMVRDLTKPSKGKHGQEHKDHEGRSG